RLVSEGSTLVIVIVLSGLMVSRVRFRSFKDLRLTGKSVGVVLLLAGACAAIVIAGLAEEIIFFKSRRAEERNASQPSGPPQPQDDDVLRELGAFDEDPPDGDVEP